MLLTDLAIRWRREHVGHHFEFANNKALKGEPKSSLSNALHTFGNHVHELYYSS